MIARRPCRVAIRSLQPEGLVGSSFAQRDDRTAIFADGKLHLSTLSSTIHRRRVEVTFQ